MDTNSELTDQITTTTATTATTTTTPPPVISAVKSTCANDGCPNPAVPSEDRGISYCSNDCVVKHCRYVASSYCGSRYLSRYNVDCCISLIEYIYTFEMSYWW